MQDEKQEGASEMRDLETTSTNRDPNHVLH